LVRFIWGKGWNFPGILAAVAERLEYFTDLGTARRSWLRMRLLRVTADVPTMLPEPAIVRDLPDDAEPGDFNVKDSDVLLHPLIDAGPCDDADLDAAPSTERLDQVAQKHYGHPALWRVLALYNAVPDPVRLDPSQVLRVPPLGAIAGTA
jgi:hypothetical protein